MKTNNKQYWFIWVLMLLGMLLAVIASGCGSGGGGGGSSGSIIPSPTPTPTPTPSPSPTPTPTPPRIDNINPARGPAGTEVTITGSNFGVTRVTSRVTFSNLVDATAYATWSNGQIVCEVPNGAQSGNVVVIVGGETSNGAWFTVETPPPPAPPVISSIDPTSGTIGSTVTITGSNFGASRDTSVVIFGDTISDSYASWSNSQIICAVPDGAESGNVMVITAAGTSNSFNFTVTIPLTYSFVWRRTGLNNPWNMTFNRVTGHICIANYGDNNIARFDTDGNQLSSVTDSSFDHPGGVASDNSGNYYVTNAPGMNIKKVFKFDGSWTNKTAWDATYRPVDVASEYGNYVAVLETQNGVDGYVEVFDRDGNLQYGPWEISDANSATSLALTPDGNILITDSWNHRILKYTSLGTLLRDFGSYGTEDTKFQYPKGIDMATDGKIFISDTGNYCFKVFSSDFDFLGKYTGTQGNNNGQFAYMFGLATDSRGSAFVGDSAHFSWPDWEDNLQKFTQNL